MIYEVVLSQTYFDQEIINRFNYLSTGTPVGITGSAALISAMGFKDTAGDLPAGTLGDKLQFFQPTEVKFNSVLAKAIREAPTDFYDYAYPTGMTGSAAGGVAASPILAFGFRTNRVRTDVARGTKRFAGVQEVNMDAGGAWVSDTVTWLNQMATLLSSVLSYTDDGNSLTFAPIVCGKLLYTAPSGKPAYKYYPTISEQLEHTAQGVVWSPYDRVRTQVSRQYSHGA
jgi:hypothetical protein